MSEISKSPAGARSTKAPQVPIVLTLSQVKRLRGRLIDLADSGEPITEEVLLPVAKQVLRKSVRRSDASSVLTQVGYKRTASQAPMADEHGAIAFTWIWKMPAAPRLVSAALEYFDSLPNFGDDARDAADRARKTCSSGSKRSSRGCRRSRRR